MAAFSEPVDPVVVTPMGITLDQFVAVCDGAALQLSAETVAAVRRAAGALDRALDDGAVVYGVTTGYGSAAGQVIAPEDRMEIQLGTVRSHACGYGPPLDHRAARGVWVAKAASLATGRTGASLALLERIVALLATGHAPVVPSIGSLGASGDLVPSGHAGLPVIGEGEVLTPDGATVPTEQFLAASAIPPLTIGPRDGLSLVNGTAVTLSIGALAVSEAAAVLDAADTLVAAGLEAAGGHRPAFDPDVAGARHHRGADTTAQRVREGLVGAPDGAFARFGVHDPYSWRCVPAVHGAVRDAQLVAVQAVSDELRGCSDNPLVDVDELGRPIIRSGGNFHGAPLGLPLDHLTLALGEIAALSSRRVAVLLSGRRGAPVGLTPIAAGGNGLTQLLATATALTLECRGLPRGTGNWLPVDDAEDHVSNATTSARSARRAVELVTATLACEALAVAAHADLAAVAPRGAALRSIHDLVRQHLGPPTTDGRLDVAISAVSRHLRTPSVH